MVNLKTTQAKITTNFKVQFFLQKLASGCFCLSKLASFPLPSHFHFCKRAKSRENERFSPFAFIEFVHLIFKHSQSFHPLHWSLSRPYSTILYIFEVLLHYFWNLLILFPFLISHACITWIVYRYDNLCLNTIDMSFVLSTTTFPWFFEHWSLGFMHALLSCLFFYLNAVHRLESAPFIQILE